MAEAKRVKHHVPGWENKLADKRAKKQRGVKFRGKTFEQLSNKDKDDLLKAVAIHLKLIEES